MRRYWRSPPVVTADSNTALYGIELDGIRAEAAKQAGVTMIQGNIFDVRARVERLSLLYINPPYDSEIGPTANNRMERLFLGHTYSWLKPKSILVMVIPGKTVRDITDTLAARFKDIRIYRIAGAECEKYDQVAVFGVRHSTTGRDHENAKTYVRNLMERRGEIPVLTANPDKLYQVPPTGDVLLTYR